MAATRLLLELSIFLLITAAATTAQTYDSASGRCREGNGGDMELAGQIMQSLVHDLIAKLPHRQQTNYCNELTQDGLKMYGYAECLRRDENGDASMGECTHCLAMVGKSLIIGCRQTGAGSSTDLRSVCFFNVGYSFDVCREGSY
ncbi:unnamed protein product [Linum trigynum]|uniref:Gnk2-homologous domain-containing protein n=1 Tax=Linum trigynum TaxID=586398 RepID=A0AAV2G320_9ROSI